jgi:hypothetical protein
MTPVARPPSARRIVLLWVSLVGLNLLLFVPTFAFFRQPADWTPFFPREHPHGAYGFDVRSALEYVKALLFRRANPDVFRLSADFTFICLALMVSARHRVRRLVLAVTVVFYCWTAVFLAYHLAFRAFFVRAPALNQDSAMVLNLVHFIVEMRSTAWLPATIGALLGLLALFAFVGLTFRDLQRWAETRPRAIRAAAGVGVWCVVSLSWFGIERDDPVVQLNAKHLVANYRASRAASLRAAAADTEVPDLRYDAFQDVRLARKPNFSLLMVEAYGEVLATWDMTPAYRELMQRVEDRLRAKGFSAASIYSAAPVHGGFSWLSIATVQSGMLIDRPEAHARLTGNPRVPTLASFFHQQGYTTYSLQPGTSEKPGIGVRDWMRHDVFVGSEELAYSGKAWGFGRIPDQYAISTFRQKHFPVQPAPRSLFFMTVSTHFPWGDHVPPYFATPEAMAAGEGATSNVDATWPLIAGTNGIGDAYRASYFRSVEYDWRLLTEFLEADASEDLVVVILGDHQPRLESNPPGEVTMNTPVHILSRDPAFIERVIALGASRGMYRPPGSSPVLQHEGLASLIVSLMSSQYGEGMSRVSVKWSPDGAALSGLRR